MTAEENNRLFCFGYGYSCDYLGYALHRLGNWQIVGTTRDLQKKALMKERGIKGLIFDYERPLNDPELFFDGVTHMLISTPPDDEGDPVFRMHEEDIVRIARQKGDLKWIGYLSSTGVYGDRGGEWVDEITEIQPTTKRGSRRAKAESQWLSLYHNFELPVHVFRIAGIYGPGRSALDSVRAGVARRIEKEGHVFSRIHVDDIVQVLMASMNNPAPGQIYNLADDEPAPSHEVIGYACALLGMEPPPLVPFAQADMAPIAHSFYRDNKRVANDKIKSELGIKLKYPDYKRGLQGCFEAEKMAENMLEHDKAASGGTSNESAA